jgi:hypothetical protein
VGADPWRWRWRWAAAVGGLVLIRFPLVRWLGNLNRSQAFDEAMDERRAAVPGPAGR